MAEKSKKTNSKPAASKADPGHPCVYGGVTVGERGQIVIPKDAREQFDIQPGDRLILLGHPGKGLMLAKAEKLREFARRLLENVG